MTQPIPMRLICPGVLRDGVTPCATLHLDEGEFLTKVHHTHSCQRCGMTWRPAVEATVGVQFLPGFKNGEPETAAPAPKPCAVCSDGVHTLPNGGCAECGFRGSERRLDSAEKRAEVAELALQELQGLVGLASGQLHDMGVFHGNIVDKVAAAARMWRASRNEISTLSARLRQVVAPMSPAEVEAQAQAQAQAARIQLVPMSRDERAAALAQVSALTKERDELRGWLDETMEQRECLSSNLDTAIAQVDAMRPVVEAATRHVDAQRAMRRGRSGATMAERSEVDSSAAALASEVDTCRATGIGFVSDCVVCRNAGSKHYRAKLREPERGEARPIDPGLSEDEIASLLPPGPGTVVERVRAVCEEVAAVRAIEGHAPSIVQWLPFYGSWLTYTKEGKRVEDTSLRVVARALGLVPEAASPDVNVAESPEE